MHVSKPYIATSSPEWVDPDDAPELGPEFFEHAAIKIGDRVIREATGTLRGRGRPPHGEKPKVQQSLRLDREVLDKFRATGPGWQARINQVLKEAKL